MSALIDVQEENDIVWTLMEGVLTAWQVQDGALVQVDSVQALLDAGERLERVQP